MCFHPFGSILLVFSWLFHFLLKFLGVFELTRTKYENGPRYQEDSDKIEFFTRLLEEKDKIIMMMTNQIEKIEGAFSNGVGRVSKEAKRAGDFSLKLEKAEQKSNGEEESPEGKREESPSEKNKDGIEENDKSPVEGEGESPTKSNENENLESSPIGSESINSPEVSPKT